jgi:Ulp1 family protease
VICNPKALIGNTNLNCSCLIFDSLNRKSTFGIKKIYQYMIYMASKTYKYEVNSKEMKVTYVKVPSQDNGYDCGVYLLQFFEDFMKNSETFLDKSVFF